MYLIKNRTGKKTGTKYTIRKHYLLPHHIREKFHQIYFNYAKDKYELTNIYNLLLAQQKNNTSNNFS